jgi:RNA polymerase sigma-70 factor (ECF subfamily)
VKPSAREIAANEAMSRYAAGDDDAFGQLYAAVIPCLESFLRRRFRHGDLVRDLIQETFVRVHKARETFRPGGSAFPWIFTIARNLASDAQHELAQRPRVPLEQVDRSWPRVSFEGPPTAEQLVTAKEVAARLDRGIDRLPEGQRAALRLVKIQGLSIASAAVVLGITATGVKLRVHKACRTLRPLGRDEVRVVIACAGRRPDRWVSPVRMHGRLFQRDCAVRRKQEGYDSH